MKRISIKAETAAIGIINDLTERAGLGESFDQIDSDTQDEIQKEWTEIIKDAYQGDRK